MKYATHVRRAQNQHHLCHDLDLLLASLTSVLLLASKLPDASGACDGIRQIDDRGVERSTKFTLA